MQRRASTPLVGTPLWSLLPALLLLALPALAVEGAPRGAAPRGDGMATRTAPAAPQAAGDYDNDGIADAADNCVFAANPSQTDADGDGLGDTCDLYPNGGPLAFGNLVMLPRPELAAGNDHFPVNMHADADGRIFVLLGTALPTTNTPANLWLTASGDGGATWGTPVRVNADGVAWANFTEMAVDEAGRIFIAWARTDSQVMLARSTDHGLSFTTSVMATTSGGFPTVAAGQGRVYVAWDTNATCAQSAVQLRRSTDAGVTFGPATTPAATASCVPALAVAADQSVHLAYDDAAVIGLAAVRNSTDLGATFGAPVQVLDAAPTPTTRIVFPALLREGSAGALHVGWAENDFDGTTYSWADYRADHSMTTGTSFLTDLTLTGNRAHPDASLRPGNDQWDFAALGGGEIRRVFQDGTAAGRRIFYAVSSNDGATYSSPQPVFPQVPDFNEAQPVVERGRGNQTLVAFARIRRSTVEPAIAYFARTGAGAVAGMAVTASGAQSVVQWQAAFGADSYDIAKGGLRNLRTTGSFAAAGSLACGSAATNVNDAARPANGDGFWYLVRGRAGSAPGTWGSLDADMQIATCP